MVSDLLGIQLNRTRRVFSLCKVRPEMSIVTARSDDSGEGGKSMTDMLAAEAELLPAKEVRTTNLETG